MFKNSFTIVAGLTAIVAVALVYFNKTTTSESVSRRNSTLSVRDEGKYGTLVPKLDSTFVVGDNSCYMAVVWMNETKIRFMLPDSMALIPDNIRKEIFQVEKNLQNDDTYPILLSFCHGKNIHDVLSEINVPEQEEIMIVIPVMYNDQKSDKSHVCSFIPVLYLNSILGVIGGLSFGLRKQYHPSSGIGGWFEVIENAAGHKTFHIKDVIKASFTHNTLSKEIIQMPKFISTLFEIPFVSVSYFGSHVSYNAAIHSTTIRSADVEHLSWTYKNTVASTVTDSVYVEYNFAMSHTTNARDMFN